MIVMLLTEHHLEFLSLKGGCRGSSESTHVKMPHCWKSHVATLILFYSILFLRVMILKMTEVMTMKNFPSYSRVLTLAATCL